MVQATAQIPLDQLRNYLAGPQAEIKRILAGVFADYPLADLLALPVGKLWLGAARYKILNGKTLWRRVYIIANIYIYYIISDKTEFYRYDI
jgi:hypothetical protein